MRRHPTHGLNVASHQAINVVAPICRRHVLRRTGVGELDLLEPDLNRIPNWREAPSSELLPSGTDRCVGLSVNLLLFGGRPAALRAVLVLLSLTRSEGH